MARVNPLAEDVSVETVIAPPRHMKTMTREERVNREQNSSKIAHICLSAQSTCGENSFN